MLPLFGFKKIFRDDTRIIEMLFEVELVSRWELESGPYLGTYTYLWIGIKGSSPRLYYLPSFLSRFRSRMKQMYFEVE